MAKFKQKTEVVFIEKFNDVIELCIEQKLKHIDEIRQDIQIYELANELTVSVATLRRWCLVHIQKSPSNYLAEYRIAKAKKLLRQGVRSVDTAKLLAFTEHKTFCTVFKRYENVPPSYYYHKAQYVNS